MSSERQALFLMVGGFLGAGKTTSILELARRFTARGLRVGLISNDQSIGLVDSVLMQHGKFDVEEITGGCFCCRFNSLVEASDRLTQAARPDVFIAEPVGSCTDLIASVSFPLRKIYGEQYRVAPLSVLVDPVRAERVLGLAQGGNFSPNVLYVYRKQLEEAELIVINKSDLLDAARLDALEAALRAAFPQADVLRIAARTGTGVAEWLDRVAADGQLAAKAAEVDYEIYADGEARLGWLNAAIGLRSDTERDGNELLRGLVAGIRAALLGVEIAHLKMTLEPAVAGADLGVINLVRSDGVAEISHHLKAPLDAGDLLINLRAEADPDVLREAALRAAADCGWSAEIRTLQFFRPGKPEPTYRMAVA